jgi:ATP-dependent helicase/nuclease subunit A
VKEPREKQWQAIRATNGHVLVVAGAGTGKTYTVVARVLYELGVPIRGETVSRRLHLGQIAAVTFTNQAAAGLKRQLRTGLREAGLAAEAAGVDLARFGTIHAFCGEVLRDFALRAERPPLGRVLDEGGAEALAADCARDALLEAVESDALAVRALLAEHSTANVVTWVVQLLGQTDVLRSAAARFQPESGGASDAEAAGGEPARERALLGLAQAAYALLVGRLERQGAVDFDRMITWTRDLLRDDAGVRRALRRRIRLLIVDEFQDVDPAQRDIAYLLAGLDGGAEDANDSEVEAADGAVGATRLMLVGDPKQSIYRFRRADVTVWRRVERDFQERRSGTVVALEDNFRSVAPVLGFVDATIGRLLTPRAGAAADYEVPYQAVRADRGDPGGAAAVELIVVPPAEDGRARRADAVRVLEADAVAERARALNAEGIAWRDMALLLAAWGAADTYAAALRDAGVPVYVLRSEGFLETREVVDLLLALRVVRDPHDDNALFGFLRSPFVGVRDETLLALARDGRRPYWPRLQSGDVAAAGADPEEAARLRRGAALVDRYSEVRDRLRSAELLSELLEESGYLGHLALLGDEGLQPRANVERFLEMVRGMGGAGAGELVRAFEERRRRKERVPPAVLHSGRDDVLTLTTIHSAKGLEWRVVFWADLNRTPNHSTGSLLIGRDEFRLKDPEARSSGQPAGWTALKQQHELEEQAEDHRVWYVAATRAKDRLVVSGFRQGGPSPGKSPAAQIGAWLPGLDEAGDSDRIGYRDCQGHAYQAIVRMARPVPARGAVARALGGAAVDPAAAELEAATAEAASAAAPVDPAALPGPPPSIGAPVGAVRHSATEFLVYDRCPRRHWFRYIVGVSEPPVGRSRTEILAAVRRGQIVHEVLERIEGEDELPALLEHAIGRWDEDAPAPDEPAGAEYRGHLSDEIRRVLRDPAYAEMAARPGARRELPFLQVLRRDAVVDGRIDLAAPSADGTGIELLDVKTTQCDADAAERKAAQYSPQRDTYIAAVDALASRPAARFTFHFSHPGRAVAQRVDDRLRITAAERVAELARGVGRGRDADGEPPPLTRHPEECFFCGYRRVGMCPGKG